jgi:FecR protein
MRYPLLAFAAAMVLAAGPASVLAQGTVTQLSGTLSVRKADGSVRILSQRSQVENGDTLNTERDSYAQVRFTDGAQITLKPATVVKIDSFRFAEDKPQEDSFFYSLVKGGLRAVTGQVGRRSPENYKLGTATATVGIRGTTFNADDCVSQQCARLESGVYVSVSDGEVVVRNAQGELGLAAGQFGLIAANQRPLFLSTDPGLQFTPPATFIRSVMAGSVVNTGRNLECSISR